MQYPICRHIKTNGLQCQAPALSETAYCYFHTRLHQHHKGFRHIEATRAYLMPGQHIELNPLEDRESVQIAISVVVNALATGQLETRRASAILYGLQLARYNCARLNTNPYPPDVVLTVEPSPEGLDLAEPGAVLEMKDYLDGDDEEDDDDDDEEDDDYVDDDE
jgi:hypothetical protein